MKKSIFIGALAIFFLIGNSGNAQSTRPILNLQAQLVNNTNTTDQAVIYFQAGATLGFNGGYDSYKLMSQVMNLYVIISGDIKLSIYALPTPIQTTYVALGFNVSITASYEIYPTEISNFPSGTKIFLVDSILHKRQLLTMSPLSNYQFSFASTDNEKRFYVYFETVTSVPPAAFDLTSPSNDAITNAIPLFQWASSEGTSFYQLYINSKLVKDSIKNTFYQLSSAEALTNCTNSWYVVANGNGYKTQSTETWSFTANPGNIYSVEGNVNYDNSINSPMKNVKLKLMNSENQIIDSTITNVTGYYKFSNKSNGNYTLTVTTNEKPGGIDPVDALLINRSYVKLYSFTDAIRKKAADLKANNQINPIDALLINRYFVKLISTFPAGKWYYTPLSLTINCQNLSNNNITAICFGDVNGSYKP